MAATLSFWCLYLVSSMVYVLPSGLPQPSAALLVALAGLFLLGRNFRIGRFERLYCFLGLFIAWTFAVSTLRFFATDHLWLLKAPLFYAYNGIAFVVASQLASRPDGSGRFAATSRWSLGAMLVVQALLILHAPQRVDDGLAREIGTFNNPNQLAYWALLAASIYMLLPGRNLVADVAVLATSAWLLLAAASKSGLAGFMIIMILWTLDVVRGPVTRFLLASTLCAGLVAHGGLQPPASPETADEAGGRLGLLMHRIDETSTKSDNTLAGRGYTSLLLNVDQLIVGTGEGDFDREDLGGDDTFHPGEFHSSFGAVLLAYGVIGLSLLLAFLAEVARSGGGVRPALWMLPSLVYGLAHQGLRFSPFWIMLACIAAAPELRAGWDDGRRVRRSTAPLHAARGPAA